MTLDPATEAAIDRAVTLAFRSANLRAENQRLQAENRDLQRVVNAAVNVYVTCMADSPSAHSDFQQDIAAEHFRQTMRDHLANINGQVSLDEHDDDAIGDQE